MTNRLLYAFVSLLLMLRIVPCFAQEEWEGSILKIPIREELMTRTPTVLDLTDEYIRLNDWKADTTYMYVFVVPTSDNYDGTILKVQIAADVSPFFPMVPSGDAFDYDMEFFDSYISLGNRIIFINYADETTKSLSSRLLQGVKATDATQFYRNLFDRFNGINQGFLFGRHYIFWLRDDGSVARVERILVD